MSSPLEVLTAVLQSTANYHLAKRYGVTTAEFEDPFHKKIWSEIESYYRRHLKVPPLSEIQSKVPEFSTVPVDGHAVTEIIESWRKQRAAAVLFNTIQQIQEHLDRGNIDDAIKLAIRGGSTASQTVAVSNDLRINRTAREVFSYLEEVGGRKGLIGIPWPWKPLNQATLGILKGNFIVFYGRPKCTKTFRLIEIGLTAMIEGYKVLFISCEMNEETIRNRLIAIAAKINYDKMKKGLLNEEEKRRIAFIVDFIEGLEGEFIFTNLSESRKYKSPSAVQAKIEQYEPQLVLVDSIHKMTDDHSGKSDAQPGTIRNINYDLQQFALNYRLPIIVTTHANRKGEKVMADSTADVAYSDSFAGDPDLLISLYLDKTLKKTIFLIKAAREISIDGFSVNSLLCNDMGPTILADGREDWSLPHKYMKALGVEVEGSIDEESRFSQ
jgi:replicative DNA helicase